MKFLIDECLSPDLVAIARDRGYSLSTHVTWLELTSKKDWTIVRRAVEDGYVLVTNNTVDFKAIAGREDVHAGLVCVKIANDLMSLDARKRLFELALELLQGEEPVNEVLEISLTSERIVRVDRYALPAGTVT